MFTPGSSASRLAHLCRGLPAHSILVRQVDELHKVTKGSFDSQASLQQRRHAPPVGRALRILLGLAGMFYVAPVYFRVPMRVAVGAWLLVFGLIGVYSLIHIVVSRRIVGVGPCL